MSEPSLAVDLRHQITNTSEHLYKRLNALLATPNLKRVRIAAAYARWDGIGLIATSLETLLKSGGEFQCIYGVNNGVTTPDSFLYSLYLRELYPPLDWKAVPRAPVWPSSAREGASTAPHRSLSRPRWLRGPHRI